MFLYSSTELKIILTSYAFGSSPSSDAIIIFDLFALVFWLVIHSIISLIHGAISFSNIDILKCISFLLIALTGFFALTDLINVFTGQPTATLPEIIMRFVTLGLFYFVSKKELFNDHLNLN